jgi:hypothetical protein
LPAAWFEGLDQLGCGLLFRRRLDPDRIAHEAYENIHRPLGHLSHRAVVLASQHQQLAQRKPRAEQGEALAHHLGIGLGVIGGPVALLVNDETLALERLEQRLGDPGALGQLRQREPRTLGGRVAGLLENRHERLVGGIELTRQQALDRLERETLGLEVTDPLETG